MGNESSSHKDVYSKNDFELVIRLAKELEHLLAEQFNATGDGLGEKIRSATYHGEALPKDLTDSMKELNRERNQLVHDRDYNKIADRQKFIQTYEKVRQQMKELIDPATASKVGCVIS